MNVSYKPNLHLALIHYPVVNKNGDIVSAAVTNLDLHDIARAVRTYGVRSFFVVTPLEDQHALVKRVLQHWTQGYGAGYNPKRCEALKTVRLVDTIEAATEAIQQEEGTQPRLVATTAKYYQRSVTFTDLRQRLDQGQVCMLLLGTAWGLADTVLQRADDVLSPIRFSSDYNHLSVRSAASIMLDRLLARKD